jgi:translation initiation factor IF-3
MNKKNKQKEKQHKLNSEITHPMVRVGEYGIISIREAQKMADEQELDLVLINENAQPPVCKIMNYEKFVYELSKKPKQKSLDVKEIKLGPNTSENDLSYRTKHIIEFLNKGHKVKLTMQFRGREMAFVYKGQELMLNLIVSVEEHGSPESMPKLEGKKLQCTLKPKTKK